MHKLLLTLTLSLLVAGCENGANTPSATPHVTTPQVVTPVSETTSSSPSTEPKSMSTNPTTTPLTTLLTSEADWKKILTPDQYYVLRQKGTERPFTNKYDEHFEKGTYACAACGTELFSSDTKFNSGCGWPAFYAAKAGDKVKLTTDSSHGMARTEVTCAHCGGHLGHIFGDAPQTPTGQRYCINSVSLKFITASPATQPAKK